MPADLIRAFTGPTLLKQHGIGVVAPFDFALDRELWRWVPDDVSLYLTRLPYVPVPVTVDLACTLNDPEATHRATRDVLTPEPLVVAYACSSGSFVRGIAGARALVETIRAAGAPAAVTTSGALADALHLLGIRRLALATPYIDEVTDKLVGYLAECGVETVARVGLGLLSHIWRVAYSDVIDIVKSVDRPDADALFISCTNVPTYDIIAPLEHALGKPVLTANQVTMWGALRAMGLESLAQEQWLMQACSKLSAA
jgi:maleate isomerase